MAGIDTQLPFMLELDVLQILQCSSSTLRRYYEAGRFPKPVPGFRGHRRRWRTSEVLAWQSGSTAPTSAEMTSTSTASDEVAAAEGDGVTVIDSIVLDDAGADSVTDSKTTLERLIESARN